MNLSPREMAMFRVSQDGLSLENELSFNDDREIVLAAIYNEPCALCYASERLKDDYVLVLLAVTKHGRALEFASASLKNNRNIVLTSVSNYGRAIIWASKSLITDYDIVLTAAKTSYGDAILDLLDNDIILSQNTLIDVLKVHSCKYYRLCMAKNIINIYKTDPFFLRQIINIPGTLDETDTKVVQYILCLSLPCMLINDILIILFTLWY